MKREKKKLKRQSGRSVSKVREMKIDASRGYHGGKRVPQGASSPHSFDDDLFRWSAKEIDWEYRGDWDWDLRPAELSDFLCAIEQYSASTWKELISQGSNKHHFQATDKLSKGARDRLGALFSCSDSEYPEQIFRFRIAAKVRLWGFREGGIFKILWYDRDHRVYPVKKKHT